jgi:hypothetical protein
VGGGVDEDRTLGVDAGRERLPAGEIGGGEGGPDLLEPFPGVGVGGEEGAKAASEGGRLKKSEAFTAPELGWGAAP